MGVTLPLPKPEALRLASARLKAWWNGEPAPDPAELTLVETDGEGAPAAAENPALAAVIAGEALFGQGRTAPSSDASDIALASSIGMNKAARLVLLGCDAGARARSIVAGCDARIEAFEREKLLVDLTTEAASAAKLAKKITAKPWDGSPGGLPKNRAEALLAMWQGTGPAELEATIFGIERALKPKASAVWYDFFVSRTDAIEERWAGPEQRSFIEEQTFLDTLGPAGLEVRSDKDMTPDVLNLLQETWVKLREGWEACQAQLLATGGNAAAAHALQLVMVWRAREAALLSGRLTVRRYSLSHA